MTMMKKRGGTKKKIEIKKRDTKQQRSVACSKRRQTVFSRAADLCLKSGSNLAVFVTSPSESSDVVYSFSGHCSASVIADCYLNGRKPPPPPPESKLGFWWENPNLYANCEDLGELELIEDRIMRTKKLSEARIIEKKEKSRFVSDQNPPNKSSSPSDQIAKGFQETITNEEEEEEDNRSFWETEKQLLLQEAQFIDNNEDDQSFWEYVNNNLDVPLSEEDEIEWAQVLA